jgi:hypothetical protein
MLKKRFSATLPVIRPAIRASLRAPCPSTRLPPAARTTTSGVFELSFRDDRYAPLSLVERGCPRALADEMSAARLPPTLSNTCSYRQAAGASRAAPEVSSSSAPP